MVKYVHYWTLYAPYPCIKEYIYIYCVINQQKHINKVCFIIYYLRACFGRFCGHHHVITQEYKQYTHNCTKCEIKTTQWYS